MKDKDISIRAWKSVMCVWLRERDDRNTKEMAEKRHAYMETYLEEFYAEWDGEK